MYFPRILWLLEILRAQLHIFISFKKKKEDPTTILREKDKIHVDYIFSVPCWHHSSEHSIGKLMYLCCK